MPTEFICEIELNTDGDWGFSETLDHLYFSSMSADGGFNGRIRFFDDSISAWNWAREILSLAAEGGLSRSKPRLLESDEGYLRGISGIVESMDRANMNGLPFQAENRDAFGYGGIELQIEWGNWSARAAVYVRDNGRISPDIMRIAA